MVPRVTHPHDQNGTNGESHRQQEADAARDLALESVNADVAAHKLLILADHDAARWLGQYREAMPSAYLVEVDAGGAFASTSKHSGVGRGDVGTAMIAANKPVYTWCSDDYDGRKLARDLHESIPKLRHIVQHAPAKWLGHGFEAILKTAGGKKPSPLRTPQQQREGPPVRRDPREPVDVSPGAIAARVIQKFGGELLIVRLPRRIGRRSRNKTEFSTGFALGPNGIWEAGGDTWNRWLREIAADMRQGILATVGSLGDRVVSGALASIQRIRRPSMVQQVREMLLGELEGLRSEGVRCSDVTVCRAEDLDADMIVIGAANGVVDLRTRRLLPPEEGRPYLVTVHAAVDYDPKATHEDVDKLFLHFDPLVRAWWWRVLGYHMWGSPSRRFYVVEGPKGGGKSTLANALGATLGPYCCRPQDSSLEVSKVTAGLNPEQLKFGPPYRFALFLEIAITRTSAEGIKRKTGNDSQSVRAPYEEEVEIKNTATMFWFCNPGTAPRLRLQDEALADRLRVLPYPSVPEDQRDLGLVNRVEGDDNFERAFLARLVAAAAAEKPGEPPDEPAVVRRATDDKISDDIGEFGEFSRRLVLDETSRLTVAEAWSAWCAQCGASSEMESEAGGITRTGLSRKLREYDLGLPRPRLIKVSGKQARGWLGWRLLSPEEADQAAAEPPTKPSDYVPGPEADQAMRDLLDGYPDDFAVLGVALDRTLMLGCMYGVRDDYRLIALRDKYENGHRLAKHLQKVAKIVAYYGPEKKPVTSAGSMRLAHPGMADKDLAAGWLDNTINMLAWSADRSRPVGPVYQQAQDRFSSVDMPKWGRKDVALNCLFEADRQLGSEAGAEAMVRKAVELLVDEFNQSPPEEADDAYIEDVVGVIKELVGLEDRAPQVGTRALRT